MAKHGGTVTFVLLLCRVLPAMVLILFGVAKSMQSQRAGAAAVRSYRVLGGPASAFAAAVLPGAEIALGLLLLTGSGTRAAGAAACLLFTAFAAAVASAVIRRLANDCGCGGALHTRQVSWKLAARNTVLAALCGVVAVLGPGAASVDHAFGDSASWPEASAAAAATALFAFMRLRPARAAGERSEQEGVGIVQHQP
jgi:uncharacterized membrane protein YphA (DoxX/SURF4 family)